MRVGPMPLVAADKLMRILRQNGHEASLEMGEGTSGAVRIEDPGDLYYIDFDESYLEVIRPELVRLALIVDDEMIATGDELEGTDWMCAKCGPRVSYEHPGNCPIHGLPLVSFEDFARGNAEQKKTHPATLIMWLIALAGILAWVAGRR